MFCFPSKSQDKYLRRVQLDTRSIETEPYLSQYCSNSMAANKMEYLSGKNNFGNIYYVENLPEKGEANTTETWEHQIRSRPANASIDS